MREKATHIQRLMLAGLCFTALVLLGCPPPKPNPEPGPRPGALLSDLEIVKVRLEAGGETYDHKKAAGDEETAGDDYTTAQTAVEPAEPAAEALLDLNFNPPSPEPAIIFFFTEGEGPEPGQPNAVRWEFAGLAAGQTVYITPKEGYSTTIFNFPETYKGEPAFSLSLPNDTIYSGPANKESFDALYAEAQTNFKEGETAYVSWFYDVDVVDGEGEIVASYDPEVRIKTYP